MIDQALPARASRFPQRWRRCRSDTGEPRPPKADRTARAQATRLREDSVQSRAFSTSAFLLPEGIAGRMNAHDQAGRIEVGRRLMRSRVTAISEPILLKLRV